MIIQANAVKIDCYSAREYAHRMRNDLRTRPYLFDDLKIRTIPRQ
jgi:hypothetical protein